MQEGTCATRAHLEVVSSKMNGTYRNAVNTLSHECTKPLNLRSVNAPALSQTPLFPSSFVRPATRATVQLTEKMAAAGADAVLVVTPCFYKGKMDRRALVQHFTKVGRPRTCVTLCFLLPQLSFSKLKKRVSRSDSVRRNNTVVPGI